MASVEITISGVLYDKYNRSQQNVVLIGEASLTGLSIGGGPIQPPAGGGGQPPGIWGPTDPRPNPPIANVPGIDNPDQPKPPEPVQPPIEWKAVWAGSENGWVVVGIPQVPHPTPS